MSYGFRRRRAEYRVAPIGPIGQFLSHLAEQKGFDFRQISERHRFCQQTGLTYETLMNLLRGRRYHLSTIQHAGLTKGLQLSKDQQSQLNQVLSEAKLQP